MGSVKSSEPTYSSIFSLTKNEDGDALDELLDDADAITGDDQDKLVCELNLNADNYRLCKAEAAHDAVLGINDASLVTKTLRAMEALHLDTKSFYAKLDDIAETIDLDVSTIQAKLIKDSVLGTLWSWLREWLLPEAKSPENQQSKRLIRFCQEFDRLVIEEEGQLLRYREPSEKLEAKELRICLPLSLPLACFRRAHYDEMGGHMGVSKNYNNAKRFYHWRGMFDCIWALTAGCLTC